MRKYTKAQIQRLKQDQKGWENLYSQILIQLETSQSADIKDTDVSYFRMIDEYLVYVVNKKKCELCCKTDSYKFMRTTVCEDKEYLPFLLCDNCYFAQNHNRVKNMKFQFYVPVSSIIKNIKKSIDQLRKIDEVHLNSYQKYDFYQKNLMHIINQIGKIFQRQLSNICKQLRKQFQILKKHTLCPQQTEVFNFLLEQHLRHSDISYSTLQNSRCNKKDQSYKERKRQNELVKEMNVLQSVSLLTSQLENKVVNYILLQVENVILKQSAHIQNILKNIVKETENFSLSVMSRKQKENEQLFPENLNEQKQQLKIVQSSKLKYLKEGVINSITHNYISEIDSKTNTLEIHSIKNTDQIVLKIDQIQNLEKLKISNNEVGRIFVEDTLRYFEFKKNDATSKIQLPKLMMHSKLLEHLRQLEFNCKISYKKDFLLSLYQFKTLQNLCLTWNLFDSFQEINESHHYLQDHYCINSLAPSPLELLQFYRAAKMRYLWIGNCDDSIKGSKSKAQMQKYLEILHFSRDQLAGIMLGQLDGRQRKICSQIIKNINMLQKLKVIYFNKIVIVENGFLSILQKHNQIQGLFLNECDNLTQNCLAKINKLSFLKKIYISQLRQLNWQLQMPSLQCFILQRCFCNIFNNVFQQSILTTLSLYQCHFLQSQFIHDLLQGQLKNGGFLTSINLGYTKANNETLVIVDKFDFIRKLHIGGTRINLFSLMKQLQNGKFKNLRKLQKLSLKEMKQITQKIQKKQMSEQVNEYYNDVFANILGYFPILTHLDLSHNCVINQRSIRFGLRYLAFLTVTQTKFTIQSKIKNKISQQIQFYSQKGQDLKVIY